RFTAVAFHAPPPRRFPIAKHAPAWRAATRAPRPGHATPARVIHSARTRGAGIVACRAAPDHLRGASPPPGGKKPVENGKFRAGHRAWLPHFHAILGNRR